MNISKAFSYQFEDIRWPTKLGLGALISLVPILNLTVGGYTVAIIRNVTAGLSEPLPQWDDLGRKFRDGLILAVASLVYAAPAFALVCLLLAMLAFSGGLSQSNSAPNLSRTMGLSGAALLIALVSFLLLYTFVLSILRPIIVVIFSRDGSFASCFRFREIWSLLSNFPGLLVQTWIVIAMAGFAIGLIVGFINLVAGWIPCLGWVAGFVLGMGSAAYLLTADAHLFGQFRLATLGAAASERREQA